MRRRLFSRNPAARVVPVTLCLLAVVWLLGPLRSQDEWSKRNTWQRPDEVMGALGAKPGSTVADVGAGQGYFTFHLAARVGPSGKVYAVDVDGKPLSKLRQRAEKEKLLQIETVLGVADDPRLPSESVHSVLVVNAYHEMREADAMLRGIRRALKPGGVLVIIDREDKPREPRSVYQQRHKIPEELVREDVARQGLEFVRKLPDLKDSYGNSWFFLVFQKKT